MAATLLDIKCRMLLPREVNEEGEEEDPRAELVEKLLEYKMYKYMSFELRDMELDAAKSFYREKDVPREVEAYRPPLDYNELLKDMTLAKLQEIFEGILKRQEDKKDPVRSNFGRIEKDEVSVDQKAVYVEDFIRTHKRVFLPGTFGKAAQQGRSDRDLSGGAGADENRKNYGRAGFDQ